MSRLSCKRLRAVLTLVLLMAASSPGQRFPGIFDLAEFQDAARFALGQNVGDQIRVLAAGDFNADGLADILLGTPFFDGPNNERPTSGGAYIILGSPDGLVARDLGSQGAPREDVTFFGAEDQDRFGVTGTSGDLNGDGVDDIIIGATLADGPENAREDAGEVHIFFGGPDLESGTIRDAAGTLAKRADITIFGAERISTLGTSLALGDVNGDGDADLIMGATTSFGPGNFRAAAGSVYVILGGPRLNASDVIDLADPFFSFDLVIHGADTGDQAGFPVKAGDLNGDGIDDIVFATRAADGPSDRRSESGEIHVLFGSPDLAAEPVRDLAGNVGPGADLTVFGQFPADGLGRALAIGDVSGDGMDDLVIAAQAAIRLPGQIGESSRSGAGEVVVILGHPSLPFDATRDTAGQAGRPADLIIFGAEGRTAISDAPDQFGSSIALSDLNGDGIDDLIIGAPGADGPNNERLDAGEVSVIFGGFNLFLGLGRDIAGEVGRPADVTFLGPGAEVNFGATLAVADLDADGLKDLIVAAPLSDGPDDLRRDAGEVFMITGR